MSEWTQLQKMWCKQKKINRQLLNLNAQRKNKKSAAMLLALMSEVNEVIAELNVFPWKMPKTIIRSNVVEEMVDIFKFWLNVLIIWGVKPAEFEEEFYRKSNVVEQKLKQHQLLKNLKKYRKICAIDLDGVLVDIDCWLGFVNKRVKKQYRDLIELKAKMNKKTYLKLKHIYRESGYKRNLTKNKGATKFISSLKRKGYKIVILTKRPYKKYARIFSDTLYWLNKNNIKYDAILFDSQKHKRIVTELPYLKFMVEDNRKIANEVSDWGYKVFLMNNKYNDGEITENVVRVDKFNQILRDV